MSGLSRKVPQHYVKKSSLDIAQRHGPSPSERYNLPTLQRNFNSYLLPAEKDSDEDQKSDSDNEFYKIKISRDPNATIAKVPKSLFNTAVTDYKLEKPLDKENNSFHEFLQSKFVHRVKANSKVPQQVKLSTVIEYYKYWCIFNDKVKINCYHHVVVPLLYKNDYGITTLTRKNKRTNYVYGMYLTKLRQT